MKIRSKKSWKMQKNSWAQNPNERNQVIRVKTRRMEDLM